MSDLFCLSWYWGLNPGPLHPQRFLVLILRKGPSKLLRLAWTCLIGITDMGYHAQQWLTSWLFGGAIVIAKPLASSLLVGAQQLNAPSESPHPRSYQIYTELGKKNKVILV